MSGANNVPLGHRGHMRTIVYSEDSNSSSSLLNPEYLRRPSSSTPSPASTPLPSAATFALPPALSAADDAKKKQALQTILSFNSEQAKKRAFDSGSSASSFPYINSGADMVKQESEESSGRKRKRKSRFGEDSEKTVIPGLPTVMPAGLSKDQEEAFLLQLKIEDATRRLRTGHLGIPINPEERSPSPEPIYSSDGKRLNTRDYRKRKELEDSRHNAIAKMKEINPDYKPPIDYRPPMTRVSDKVMIPQEEYPAINFVGLLIGPRGNTLKGMEKDTGAKIIIRGKGSVKEGKVGRKDGYPMPGEDEPLHAYVTSTNAESVKNAIQKINQVIQEGIEVPEGENDLRKHQLRELALLNGTLREGEGFRCTNCGASDHKAWQCPDRPNLTNNIVCSSCGNAGHIAKDCTMRRPGTGFGEQPAAKKMDDEYLSLMAELGEAPPPGTNTSPPSDSKPWQKTSTTSATNLFNTKPPTAPRAITGPQGLPQGPPPPPPPPPGEFGSPPPPSVGGGYGYGKGWNPTGGSGTAPPHWASHPPPPPPGNVGGTLPTSGPPPSLGHVPPPHGLGAPPPPPPPGSSDWESSTAPAPPGTSTNASALPSSRPAGGSGFFGGPPPPPPPSQTTASTSNWSQPPPGGVAPGGWGAPPPPPSGWGGVPPPPPQTVTAQTTQTSEKKPNVNWSSLIGAPPPPPPPAST